MTTIAPRELERPAHVRAFAPSPVVLLKPSLRERAHLFLDALQAARAIDSAGSSEARRRMAVRFAQGLPVG